MNHFNSILRTLLFLLSAPCLLNAQDDFHFTPVMETVTIDNLPGIHSYAWAQHDDRLLIIGGRTDGIHARQPFNAFPASENNTYLYVVDPEAGKCWKRSLNDLPTDVREQFQSANMNFYQDGNQLVLIGGYVYSEHAGDHITFPLLTTVPVAETIDAIVQQNEIKGIQQLHDSIFAVAGGQLTKLGDEFFLVGGHRFDGRYNPMLGPTFRQTYTNEVRKFRIISYELLKYSGYSVIRDADHLHRRDFNLIPQVFENGKPGYCISSGVFQYNYDLPYLYPIELNENSITARKDFNQFLSHYHTANLTLYDRTKKKTQTLFFGGMSQYYYEGDGLVQDNDVPFVNTISLLNRNQDNSLKEYKLEATMPGLQGAASDFIPRNNLPMYSPEIIDINAVKSDTVFAGYIFGGIRSSSLNPFANNAHEETAANTSLYRVKLIRSKKPVAMKAMDGSNPFAITAIKNPDKHELIVGFNLNKPTDVSYILTDEDFDLVAEKSFDGLKEGDHRETISLEGFTTGQVFNLTVVFNNMFYESKQVQVE